MQNRVMLSGDSSENAAKNVSKKTTLSVQHTFFVHFFGVLHDYNVKLPQPS